MEEFLEKFTRHHKSILHPKKSFEHIRHKKESLLHGNAPDIYYSSQERYFFFSKPSRLTLTPI
jgi:hypothetical protein